MKYGWKRNVFGVKADIVGKEIERIVRRKKGTVQPDDLVSAAKPISSPLHKCFTWDDDEAARKCRYEEARFLLRMLVVEVEGDDEEVIVTRAFVSVEQNDERCFVSINTALKDDDMRSQLLSQAKGELMSFRMKYDELKELSRVFCAIDAL